MKKLIARFVRWLHCLRYNHRAIDYWDQQDRHGVMACWDCKVYFWIYSHAETRMQKQKTTNGETIQMTPAYRSEPKDEKA